jgi:hypothetical protein
MAIIFRKCFFFALGLKMLKIQGLKHNWATIRNWCIQEPAPEPISPEASPTFSKKCPEIEKLADYQKTPSKGFWNSFPININKCKVSTKVNISKLENLINQCAKNWTYKEKNIAEKCLKNSNKLFSKNRIYF